MVWPQQQIFKEIFTCFYLPSEQIPFWASVSSLLLWFWQGLSGLPYPKFSLVLCVSVTLKVRRCLLAKIRVAVPSDKAAVVTLDAFQLAIVEGIKVE
mmetsp:Transcript_32182/g.59929  ORF Transcript_32182/g.59929 Transcript_32182/m.59929 type:complete len:97 (-) Transcript_32182:795-1085(-)